MIQGAIIGRLGVFLLAALVGLFIEGTVVHGLYPAAVAPDFILFLVIAIALSYPNIGGLLAVFGLGLLGDFASARFIGPNAAGYVLAFCLVNFLSGKVYAERGPALAILAFVCALAKSVGFGLLMIMYTTVNVFDAEGRFLMLSEALLTALLAPIIVRLMRGQDNTLAVGRQAFRRS